MVLPIDSSSAVPVQQRISQIQAKVAPAPADTGTGQPTQASSTTGTTGATEQSSTQNKLSELAQLLGIDKQALLSALQSGDTTKVTALITSAGMSSLGAAASSDSKSTSDDSSAPMGGLGGASTAELQSKLASLGRTGLQFDGRL